MKTTEKNETSGPRQCRGPLGDATALPPLMLSFFLSCRILHRRLRYIHNVLQFYHVVRTIMERPTDGQTQSTEVARQQS